MAGTDAISKEELEILKKQWLEEMKANMKVIDIHKKGAGTLFHSQKRSGDISPLNYNV
jgi:hypothetical protein